MDQMTLARAVTEAETFIMKAKKVFKRLDIDGTGIFQGSAETAACRRASMDLTRTLAELRKPG